jgi:copper transport protein
VALLALTGFVNAMFLVGSPTNLFHSIYGRWLLAKIILFMLITGFGAVNLLGLKPRLDGREAAAPAARRLRSNVRVELFIAMIIITIVAIMGVLPPAGR